MIIELIGYFFVGIAATIMLAIFMLFIMAVQASGGFIKNTAYGIILVSMITALGYSVIKLLGGF